MNEALLVCDATCRHTLAQALSHPYFDSLHDGLETARAADAFGVLPKQAPSKTRRDAGPDSHVLHKGNVYMMAPGSKPVEMQWEAIDLWITRSASMSYFRMQDDEVHQVSGGRHVKQALLSVPNPDLFTFELRWPDCDFSAAFQCDGEADLASWLAAIKEAKSGLALSMNFGHHLKHLRAKPRVTGEVTSLVSSRAPVLTDILFVLRSGGDRNCPEDWVEYEMCLAKNGSLQYWDGDLDIDVTLCTPRDLRTATVKKLNGTAQCLKPWAFQLCVEGSNNPPLDLAASTKASRENWVKEIRTRQQSLGTLSPTREFIVANDVTRLGMEFQNGPPEPAIVSIVKPGMWAQSVNINPGDEIVELNDIAVKDMSFNEFTSELQQRPLKIGFSIPRDDKFAVAKSQTQMLKKPKAAPKKKMSKFANKSKPVPAG